MELTQQQLETIKRLDDPRYEKAWAYLNDKHGITKDSLSNEQKFFLAIGASTTPVPSTMKVKGEDVKVSLRIGKNDTIRATVPLKELDTTQVITTDGVIKLNSERMKQDLTASTFVSRDGKRFPEHHYASARYPVKNQDGKEFVVSRDQFTNQLVGTACALIYSQMRDWKHLYGTDITEDTKRKLARGQVVVLEVENKEGKKEDVAYQYNSSTQSVVRIPIELMQKREIDACRQKAEAETKAVEQKTEVAQEKTKGKGKSKVEPAQDAEKKEGKKSKRNVAPIEEPAQKETKGKKMKV